MLNQNQAKPGDIVQIEENGATWICTVIQSDFTSRDLDDHNYRESVSLGEGVGVYKLDPLLPPLSVGRHALPRPEVEHREEKLAVLLVVAEFNTASGFYSFIDNNVRIWIRADLSYRYTHCTIKLM